MGKVAVGKNTTIQVEGTFYPVTDFNFDADQELNEATHGGTEGRRTYALGCTGAVGTIVGNYNPDDNPMPKVYDGAEFTIKHQAKVGDDLSVIELPAIANNLSWGAPVKGLVSFVISFTANGWDQSDLGNL
jgi:hypothetical protein